MIRVEAVSFAYGGARALAGVDLTLTADRVALLGPNGAGKSTLIGLMTTVRKLQDGSIVVGDADLSDRHGRAAVRRRIGYVPQSMALPLGWTCEEFLAYACWMHGEPDFRRAVPDALALVDLADRADSKIRTLSGGMRQRLCVAQAIVHRPSVLVVDEPTVGLDPLQRVQVRNVLAGLDCQLVIATHLVDDVAAMAEYVVVLDEGSVVFSGDIATMCGGVVSAEAVEAAYLRHVAGERS